MAPPQTAAALIIGNEILSGKIAEGNLRVLAKTLGSIGVRLERVVMVLDDRTSIAHEVRSLSKSYDVVFTSGGVGPTHDDVTIASVAEAFGVAVEQSPEIEEMLRMYYGSDLTEGHLFMARIPQGAELVTTDEMPWHTIVMKNVWILPGVPQIFQMKMPVVRTLLAGGVAFQSLAIYTTLDEGHLKPLLDRVVAEHPDVDLGSYPKWREPRYRTKVTFDARDLALVERARDALVAILPADSLVRIDEE
jgi:molybdenum cofactor synthesis domain-containing protein